MAQRVKQAGEHRHEHQLRRKWEDRKKRAEAERSRVGVRAPCVGRVGRPPLSERAWLEASYSLT